jgi:hypothetical protein
MKTIALTLIAAGLGLAQSQSGNQSGQPATDAKPSTPAAAPAQKPKTVPQKPKATPKAQERVSTIPQGATLVEPNLYRYTDASGKTWMYRQTPFGVSKYEDKPAAAPQPPAADSEPVKVTDLGDSVRFEKKTAFGVSKWVRKKTELTDDEKALVAGQAGGQADKPVLAPSEKKTSENQ